MARCSTCSARCWRFRCDCCGVDPLSDPVDKPNRPFSPACERNREPILAALREHYADRKRVLEIGSGTGQHAVHFAAALPFLQWQTSDRSNYLDGLRGWLDEANLPNTPAPIALDVDGPWPTGPFDAVFSANTLHIMSWMQVQQLFARLPEVTTANAKLVIYGPFHRDGMPSSPSNTSFDASLRQRAAHMGLRNASAVDALAAAAGFRLLAEIEMPACNLCRIWQRSENVHS